MQAPVPGIERDNSEVEASLHDLNPDLTGGYAPDVDEDARVPLPESFNQRKQDVDAPLIRSDQHPAALQIAELTNR